MQQTPCQVNPKDIEPKLKALWESLDSVNHMRSCLFNLVIYTTKDDRTEYVKGIAENIVKHFPSRIILIVEDNQTKKDQLQTNVSLMVFDQGERSIYCDFIEVFVAGEDRAKTPSLVLPHIVSDLPLILLWSMPTSKDHPFFKEFAHLSSKIIFDSETADTLPKFASFCLSDSLKSRKMTLADLNWARIEGWRTLISTVFYSDEKMAMLKNMTKLRIIYNDCENNAFKHTSFQATYFMSWFLTRLGMDIKSHDESASVFLSVNQQGQECRCEIIKACHQEIRAGRLLTVEIDASDQESYHFTRSPSHCHVVEIRHSTKSYCETPSQYMLDTEDSGQSFVSEVFHEGMSEHFYSTLHLIHRCPSGQESNP